MLRVAGKVAGCGKIGGHKDPSATALPARHKIALEHAHAVHIRKTTKSVRKPVTKPRDAACRVSEAGARRGKPRLDGKRRFNPEVRGLESVSKVFGANHRWFSQRIKARSITFCSSRILPTQG